MNRFPSRDKNDSEKATGLLFMRVYNKWHSLIKNRLRELDITHPQFVVLTSIGYLSQFGEEVTQVMISRLAGMDVMSLSQILKLLEKRGFLRREAHSSDTRAKSVRLTEAGQDRMERALPLVESVDAQFFGALKEEEDGFLQMLLRLNADCPDGTEGR